jgi:ZIP family zinc transporter
MTNSNVLIAFALTLFAGLSTGIGSLIAFFTQRTQTKFLSVTLGFSAGVMLYVSFVEILNGAFQQLSAALGRRPGSWVAIAAFFGGIALIAAIDKLVPTEENPHEIHRVEEMDRVEKTMDTSKLMRVGSMTALAIVIHNFPEGLATFTSAINTPPLGIAIAIAIAIHNIPEGIAVAVPIYCATGQRRKAFILSLLSGFSEPVGAAVGYLLLMPFLNDVTFGVIYAAVAGIMVFISLDELLPTAREYGEHHLSMYGLIGGMAVMSVSLILLL